MRTSMLFNAQKICPKHRLRLPPRGSFGYVFSLLDYSMLRNLSLRIENAQYLLRCMSVRFLLLLGMLCFTCIEREVQYKCTMKNHLLSGVLLAFLAGDTD